MEAVMPTTFPSEQGFPAHPPQMPGRRQHQHKHKNNGNGFPYFV
jgi:hypothetical protein